MSETPVSIFRARAARHPDRVALRALAAGGAPTDGTLTWGEWAEAARRFSAAVVAAGRAAGERVAVLAGNDPVWPISELGALSAGLIGVGVYPTSSAAQVAHVLADAGASVLVVDTAEQLAKVLEAAALVPGLRTVVCADPAAAAAQAGGSDPEVLGWAEWLERGARALTGPASVAAEVERRASGVAAGDVAILIYTSGSTGEPKGARLTHGCLLASAESIRDTLGLQDSDSSLSFLPFCHSAERIFGLHTRILCGMEAGLVADHTRVWEAARAFGPTVFGGLPRFYEKAYERLEAERAGAAAAEREVWDRVLRLGRERSRLRRAAAPVPEPLEQEWRERGEPLFERVRALFGGRVRLATSGGAALPEGVAETLDALGLTVLGAYGLTEHLCVAFNRPERYAFDGVGPEMPGTEVRFADDGEILVRRSALTFSGYHAKPEETEAAFTPDGEWLLTGDFGARGADGMLRVTGRKKELIALSTGKKVAPLPIEARLAADEWIGQAVLFGEGRKYLSALVSLRRPVVEAWAREQRLGSEYEELIRHPAVLERLQRSIDAVNGLLSRPERIRRFRVLERELSVEADELTPTLKVRRSVVAERYGPAIEELYR